MPSAAEARALFRAFMREGSKFPNYNIREYVRRRAREQFKEASKVSDEGQLTELWSKGKETIEMVKRQAVVYQLYARKQKSVMDM